MNPRDKDITAQAEEALRQCLKRVPFLRVLQVRREPRLKEARPDLAATVKVKGRTVKLLVEVNANGEPRTARNAANQLVRSVDQVPKSYGVFIAPYISSAAADICTNDGLGYVDLSGNCRLCFGSVFVEQRGRPNRYSEKRRLRSIFSPKAERILRVLAAEPRRTWKTVDLAAEAGVSIGHVAKVKKRLADREWIEAGRKGFALIAPEELLNEWSKAYDFGKNDTSELYSLESLPDIEARLAQVLEAKGIRYALTAFSAAARMAAAVRYRRVTAYVADLPESLLSELGMKRVDSGANVSLAVPYDAGVFYGSRQVEGVTLASPLQVYLDLLSFRGRGAEAAEAIRRDILEKSW